MKNIPIGVVDKGQNGLVLDQSGLILNIKKCITLS